MSRETGIHLPGQGRLRFDRRGPRKGVRAWRVAFTDEVRSLVGEASVIAAARSRGAAQFAAIAHARGVGYPVGFGEASAVRAPEFDAWAAQARPGVCVRPDAIGGAH
jgi:hypothetical protein